MYKELCRQAQLKKSRILSFLITVVTICVVVFPPAAQAAQTPKIFIDGVEKVFALKPVIIGGSTLVPMRPFFEALGAEVVWHEDGLIESLDGETRIEMRIGERAAFRISSYNSTDFTLDVPPQLVGGSTYVPLRFVGESLGMKVDYSNGIITIDTSRDAFSYGDPADMSRPTPSFAGFFRNPDYSDPSVFLADGTQTKPGSLIKDAASKIAGKNQEEKLSAIYAWIYNNMFGVSGPAADAVKFTRTAEEIVASKFLTGCTDYALVYAAVARECGIPSVIVDALRVDWITDMQVKASSAMANVRGHFFVEAYADGKWFLVDSTAGYIYPEYDNRNFSLPSGYYAMTKSLDVWDSGLNADNIMAAYSGNFHDFDPARYADPGYGHYSATDPEREAVSSVSFLDEIKKECSQICLLVASNGGNAEALSSLNTNGLRVDGHSVESIEQYEVAYAPKMVIALSDQAKIDMLKIYLPESVWSAFPELFSSVKSFSSTKRIGNQDIMVMKAESEDALNRAILAIDPGFFR